MNFLDISRRGERKLGKVIGKFLGLEKETYNVNFKGAPGKFVSTPDGIANIPAKNVTGIKKGFLVSLVIGEFFEDSNTMLLSIGVYDQKKGEFLLERITLDKTMEMVLLPEVFVSISDLYLSNEDKDEIIKSSYAIAIAKDVFVKCEYGGPFVLRYKSYLATAEVDFSKLGPAITGVL